MTPSVLLGFALMAGGTALASFLVGVALAVAGRPNETVCCFIVPAPIFAVMALIAIAVDEEQRRLSVIHEADTRRERRR